MSGFSCIFEFATAHEYLDDGPVAIDVDFGPGRAAVPTLHDESGGSRTLAFAGQATDTTEIVWHPAIPATVELLRQAAILMRRESYGFSLHVPLAAGESPGIQMLNQQAPEAVLEFLIRPSDAGFYNYTASVAATGDSAPAVASAYTVTTASPTAEFSKEDHVWRTPREASSPPILLVRVPLAVLNIPKAGTPYQPATSRLSVAFASRKTRWRYVVAATAEQLDRLSIRDTKSDIGFKLEDAAVWETLPKRKTDKSSVSFLCDTQLPLKAKPVYEFGLFSDAMPDQPLVARLPQASPGHFKRLPDSEGELLSEIYVN